MMLHSGMLAVELALTTLLLYGLPVASGLSSVTFSRNETDTETGNAPCDALIAVGLGHLLLFATDAEYTARIDSYWSASARLYPWCIAQPENTAEVAQVLTTLVDAGPADWHIAVRGGGHNQWPSNNVARGITIDLGLMNETTYDATTNLALVGPGGTWTGVYGALLDYGNITAVGGRVGDVGISGFLLGGGNSYYSGRQGLGCDNVENYELVLANGTIVNANNNTNADLFKALKGGGSNLGIVTRFDLATIPYTDIYAGAVSWSLDYTDAAVSAFVNFANLPQSAADDALVFVFLYNTDVSADVIITSSLVNTQGNTSTTSFDEFKQIPSTSGDGMEIISLEAYAIASASPAGLRSTWFTLTFKNDAAIISRAVELHNELVADLQRLLGPEAFTTEAVFQPLPAYFVDVASRGVGNVLGLRDTENGVLFLLEVNVLAEANEAVGHAYAGALTAEIEAFAVSAGGNLDWRYLNYADPSQNPLGSYGEANVGFIREVAARYDPTGVFQTRFPHGFKISNVA